MIMILLLWDQVPHLLEFIRKIIRRIFCRPILPHEWVSHGMTFHRGFGFYMINNSNLALSLPICCLLTPPLFDHFS